MSRATSAKRCSPNLPPERVVLSVAIQHHPARAELIPALAERLGECEVVADPLPEGPPNPLRTYLECLRLTPDEATHRLVIQDDAWPCDGFRALAQAAIEERPNDIVCFYVPDIGAGGRNRVIRALRKRESWAQLGLGGWVPAVAACWPIAAADDFVEWCPRVLPESTTADDKAIVEFCKRHGVHVWATVPSLVEHPDDVPSLLGKEHGAGKIRWRVAAAFRDGD